MFQLNKSSEEQAMIVILVLQVFRWTKNAKILYMSRVYCKMQWSKELEMNATPS